MEYGILVVEDGGDGYQIIGSVGSLTRAFTPNVKNSTFKDKPCAK
jgi:hypothetical protein